MLVPWRWRRKNIAGVSVAMASIARLSVTTMTMTITAVMSTMMVTDKGAQVVTVADMQMTYSPPSVS